MKYRKRPVTVQAIQYTGENYADVCEFAGSYRTVPVATGSLIIRTPEGAMAIRKGDWVVQDEAGGVYPCKPDFFEQTYEPVDG